MELNGSVAIITGASKGIGRAIAHSLAGAGVRVVLAARNSSMLSELQEEIQKLGGTSIAVPKDVTSEFSVQNLIHEANHKFGRIDILINNAGVGVFNNVDSLSVADYDSMMDVNLKGTFLCSKEVLPVMKKQQSGAIINIASLAGKNSFAGGAVYSASKWGLIGFARSLMLEVREHHIRVVTIAPGSVNTSFSDKHHDQPMVIQPIDVAETVLFALSMPDRVNVSEIDIRPTIKPR